MAKKLYTKGDVLVLRDTHIKGIWIPPSELKTVVHLVNEVAYTLYTVYRTYPFRESDELTDKAVGSLIGWSERKVQRYRKVLESAELYAYRRYGTKTDGVTKVFVGLETVALFNAGLPADAAFPQAIHKLKKQFNVQSSMDFINKIPAMTQAFESNPQDYT